MWVCNLQLKFTEEFDICLSFSSKCSSRWFNKTIARMELVQIHKDHPGIVSVRKQCCQILNHEWPRSETLRWRMLDSSRDDLPLSLALVQWFDDQVKAEKQMKFYLHHHKKMIYHCWKNKITIFFSKFEEIVLNVVRVPHLSRFNTSKYNL